MLRHAGAHLIISAFRKRTLHTNFVPKNVVAITTNEILSSSSEFLAK